MGKETVQAKEVCRLSFSYSDIVFTLKSWREDDFANVALILIPSVYIKRNNFKETLLRLLG